MVLVVVKGGLVSASLQSMGGGGSGGACLEELNIDCLGAFKPLCLPSWSCRTRFWESLKYQMAQLSISIQLGAKKTPSGELRCKQIKHYDITPSLKSHFSELQASSS